MNTRLMIVEIHRFLNLNSTIFACTFARKNSQTIKLTTFVCLNFQLFFGTVLFGLWHGLVLLPVLLSVIGPAPYPTARSNNTPTSKVNSGIII